MLRTFLAGLGLVFATLVVFSASFLGNVAADIDSRAAEHEQLAIAAVRQLSHRWSIADIEPLCTDDAREELAPALSAELDGLKGLGPFLYADATAVEARWSRRVGRSAQLATGLAATDLAATDLIEALAALVSRSVKVTFLGKFTGGQARVTAELRRERGRMKLWRLRIETPQRLRPDENPGRRVISFA